MDTRQRGTMSKYPERARVLVTGGTGFVGSYLARALLDNGYSVCLYDLHDLTAEGRFVVGPRLEALTIELGSIDDPARLLDVVKQFAPTYIVHMAMSLDPAFLARHRTSGLRVNIGGTINALEATHLFGVRRLVYFSSVGVLPPVQYEPIDAAHPLVLARRGPGTAFYGAAKAAGEVLCYAYQQALGLDFRVIRPSAVYGLGMNRYPGPIKDMVEGSVRGETLRFESGGSHIRDYTHAADIASLVVALLRAPEDADRIFYGATGEPLTPTSDVARLVMELIPGADIKIQKRLSEDERAVAELRGRLSIDNARRQLGWEPTYRSLKDGIAHYAAQYRDYLAAQNQASSP